MQLQVKPYTHNIHPLGGLLIKGSSPVHWLQQLQYLEVDLQQVAVYALPGTTANSLWGCFIIVPPAHWKQKNLNAIEPFQCVHGLLFIPQQSVVHPIIGAAETEKLFRKTNHLLHPEIGLVILDQPVNWNSLLLLPDPRRLSAIIPAERFFIPGKIQRAEIHALPAAEMLQAMEDNIFPRKEKFGDKPLNWKEKIKLGILKTLFTKKESAPEKEKTGLMKLLEKIAAAILPANNKWVENLAQDLDELEERSRSEMQKLMDLFKNDPDEALKYAIPLDESGAGRGGMTGSFKMGRRWGSFDLFGGKSPFGASGRTLFADDSFQLLQQQYRKTAADLIKEGKYHKAAFVYMKLLKDNHNAAKTLEEGKLYAEAAAVYLKHLQNKNKAADCYEKGQMITDAIELYKELKQFEKTGDLYMQQQKQKEALGYYQLVADEHIESGRYVKAALLMRNKMHDTEPAQELLLTGWRKDRDAFNCINNYFQNIQDPVLLLQAIETIYKKETTVDNKPVFLTVLRHELNKHETVTDPIREMAYEIVAGLAKTNPEIVSELKHFNADKSLQRDILRYKAQNK